MIRTIERLSEICGKLSAAMFFVVGGMITYEVVARYAFLAPTSWAEELSRFVQIWATYLAAAYVLKNRHLIRIDLLTSRLGPGWRRLFEAATIMFIGVFCLVAIYYGIGIVAESVEMGRATSTMLAVPRWMTESAIPIGFGILLLQCVAEMGRIIANKSGEPDGDGS
ncbi:MAG: TRAP transporter small permease [Rhodospirillales bacterium]|nr:TRAP transporter small permease [Rhodospirillales bacterium]